VCTAEASAGTPPHSDQFEIHMQKTISSVASRFDLRNTGLTQDQLKAIAGARPTEKSQFVSCMGITRCCWG
jgi:hypothetical protein